MADFEAWFEGRGYEGQRKMRYLMMGKEWALKQAKEDGKRFGAEAFSLSYASGRSVGYWARKGTRWYREW